MIVYIKVRLFGSSYIICYVTEDVFMLQDEQCYKSIGLKVGECYDIDIRHILPRAKKVKHTTNALFLQPFIKELIFYKNYRTNVVYNMNKLCNYPRNGIVFLKLILEPPDKEIIDYAWNERMLYLVWTKVEIEHAFSWLSTLGGAYSALGDQFDYCAEEAGRISIGQYKLSKLLGDDGLAARSRLYSAIAHAQKHRLKLARHIVRNVAAFARETHDVRLNRMCQGVWAKLKYLRKQRPVSQIEASSEQTVSSKGDGYLLIDKLVIVK